MKTVRCGLCISGCAPARCPAPARVRSVHAELGLRAMLPEYKLTATMSRGRPEPKSTEP